jgi:hypothetical protein
MPEVRTVTVELLPIKFNVNLPDGWEEDQGFNAEAQFQEIIKQAMIETEGQLAVIARWATEPFVEELQPDLPLETEAPPAIGAPAAPEADLTIAPPTGDN